MTFILLAAFSFYFFCLSFSSPPPTFLSSAQYPSYNEKCDCLFFASNLKIRLNQCMYHEIQQASAIHQQASKQNKNMSIIRKKSQTPPSLPNKHVYFPYHIIRSKSLLTSRLYCSSLFSSRISATGASTSSSPSKRWFVKSTAVESLAGGESRKASLTSGVS